MFAAYVVKLDVEWTLADIVKLSRARLDGDTYTTRTGILTIQPDCKYRRLAATVDVQAAACMLNNDAGNDMNGRESVDDMYSRLQNLNAVVEAAVTHHLKIAVNNIMHNVWQRFVNIIGERAPAVTCSHPLMNRYFLSTFMIINSQFTVYYCILLKLVTVDDAVQKLGLQHR